MLTQILHSHRLHRRMAPEEESLATEISASSARPVLSLVLEFDLESGSTWKGPVVPSAKTAET